MLLKNPEQLHSEVRISNAFSDQRRLGISVEVDYHVSDAYDFLDHYQDEKCDLLFLEHPFLMPTGLLLDAMGCTNATGAGSYRQSFGLFLKALQPRALVIAITIFPEELSQCMDLFKSTLPMNPPYIYKLAPRAVYGNVMIASTQPPLSERGEVDAITQGNVLHIKRSDQAFLSFVALSIVLFLSLFVASLKNIRNASLSEEDRALGCVLMSVSLVLASTQTTLHSLGLKGYMEHTAIATTQALCWYFSPFNRGDFAAKEEYDL